MFPRDETEKRIKTGRVPLRFMLAYLWDASKFDVMMHWISMYVNRTSTGTPGSEPV